ncbi:MAG: molybdopterin molybdotransferase MoeA [Spirochaetales bacterium]|nr:molybdopterin molybdotransferase MoeA [Spirochaetales bacterium]MCF7939464.1 molybdopterin molybdotransferase MoeA [Spirochaetales bacterium]
MNTMELMHPDQAFALLANIEYRLPEEETGIHSACGRVLSQPVLNRVDSPPFDKAAMDGFAVNSADYRGEPGETLRLIETVAAGQVPRRTPGPGECVQIMTGAKMPEGTDKVIRVEYTDAGKKQGPGPGQAGPGQAGAAASAGSPAPAGGEQPQKHTELEPGTPPTAGAPAPGSTITVHTPEPAGNMIDKGENIRAGEVLLQPRRLAAHHIGILAAGGVDRIPVRRQARVGILTTGSEICEPGQELGAGRIYNSNGSQLAAQVESAGAIALPYGIVEDEPSALEAAVDHALEEADILLLSGGVSMGEFDFVPQVLRKAGVEVLFHRLAIKPGRPTLFGRKGDSFVFGLPGNPVSTFIIFEVMVRQFLGILNGVSIDRPVVRGTLSAGVFRKSSSRVEYRPARFYAGVIEPLSYYGSSHLNALSEANCIYRMDQGVSEFPEGMVIDARLI